MICWFSSPSTLTSLPSWSTYSLRPHPTGWHPGGDQGAVRVTVQPSSSKRHGLPRSLVAPSVGSGTAGLAFISSIRFLLFSSRWWQRFRDMAHVCPHRRKSATRLHETRRGRSLPSVQKYGENAGLAIVLRGQNAPGGRAGRTPYRFNLRKAADGLLLEGIAPADPLVDAGRSDVGHRSRPGSQASVGRTARTARPCRKPCVHGKRAS